MDTASRRVPLLCLFVVEYLRLPSWFLLFLEFGQRGVGVDVARQERVDPKQGDSGRLRFSDDGFSCFLPVAAPEKISKAVRDAHGRKQTLKYMHTYIATSKHTYDH